MRISKYLKIIGVLLCFSCSKPNPETEHLFIRQDKETVTIEVTGNIDSKIFLINFTYPN